MEFYKLLNDWTVYIWIHNCSTKQKYQIYIYILYCTATQTITVQQEILHFYLGTAYIDYFMCNNFKLEITFAATYMYSKKFTTIKVNEVIVMKISTIIDFIIVQGKISCMTNYPIVCFKVTIWSIQPTLMLKYSTTVIKKILHVIILSYTIM